MMFFAVPRIKKQELEKNTKIIILCYTIFNKRMLKMERNHPWANSLFFYHRRQRNVIVFLPSHVLTCYGKSQFSLWCFWWGQ